MLTWLRGIVPRVQEKALQASDFVNVQVGNTSALMEEVSKGPVAIAVSAAGKYFLHYSSGVIRKC